MCMWRRSLKVFYQCAKIVDHLRSKRYVYVLLTLTVRNCLPAALSRTLDDMSRAWHAMIKTDEFTGAVAGYYKTVEIKHRVRDYKTGEWLEQDDYHPHIHVLLACKKGYSESSSMYVTQKRWREIWARTLKIDYDPRVDVRYVKGRTGKIIAEVCKYGCKAEEYIMPDHWELSCSTVALLDDVLHKRRFADFGGEFKKAYRELGLAKNENDLINVDPDAPSIKPSYMLDIYRWAGGYAQYVLSEE